MAPSKQNKMPEIVIKGKTGTVKTRRVGTAIVVEKTIERGVITETHKGEGKRVTGKRNPKEVITLTATEVKGLGNDTEEKLKKAMADEKEANLQNMHNMNMIANRHAAMLETAHKAVVKKLTARMNTLANKLAGERHDSKANVSAWTNTKTQRDAAKAVVNTMTTYKKEKKDKK